MHNKKLSTNICINTVIPKSDEEKALDIIIDDVENFDDNDVYEEELFLTIEQSIQIFKLFIDTDMMVPVFLAALIALRRSEIAGILKSKINKKIGTLVIDAVRVRVGNKTVFKKRNKTKKSTRILYLPKLLLEALSRDEQRQEENRKKYGDRYIESKFLCVDDMGNPLKVTYISSEFQRVFDNFIEEEKKKAEKENREFNFPYVTIHKLRHLNLTALLENGISIVDVMDSAGHSCVSTTMGYTHHYTKNKKEVANKIDEVFSPHFKIS